VLPRRPNDFQENDMIYSHLEKHSEISDSSSSAGDVAPDVKILRTYLSAT
jgi:hypothetical protein